MQRLVVTREQRNVEEKNKAQKRTTRVLERQRDRDKQNLRRDKQIQKSEIAILAKLSRTMRNGD